MRLSSELGLLKLSMQVGMVSHMSVELQAARVNDSRVILNCSYLCYIPH